jgi:hypothetical protein
MILVFIILALSLFLLFNNKPDIIFWISLSLYFDPGGILYNNVKDLFGINPSDVFFASILFSAFIKFGTILPRIGFFKEFRIFFKWFILFFLISFILFYGIIAPLKHGYFNPSYYLIKNRTAFYSIILLYLSFQFFIDDTKNFFLKAIIWTAIIILPLFIFSVISGIHIIPVYTMDRYSDSGIIRTGMSSYGMMYYVIPLLTILIFLRWNYMQKIPGISRNQIYFTGILMIIILLITLTRRDIISLLAGFLISWMIVNWQKGRVFKISALYKLVIPLGVVILLLYAFLPKYIGWLGIVFKDTGGLLVTGKDINGNVDYRMTGGEGLILAKEYIIQYPVFGMGYYPYSFQDVVSFADEGNKVAIAMNDSAEVSVIGTTLRMGLIGILFFLRLYYLQIKFGLKNFKLFKSHYRLIYAEAFNFYFVFLMLASVWALKFTFEYLNLLKEFTSGMILSDFCILSGVYFASAYRVQQVIIKSQDHTFTDNSFHKN